MERAVIFGTCPQCDGTRLADPARTCFIDGRSIADACAMQISDLAQSSLIHGHLSPMDDVVTIDQSPIKGSRRSNPATYTGLLDHIRKAFAKANKDKGAKSAYFSANHLG